MIAIPAIDIINGKVVRLRQGDYNQQTDYPLNPTELARSYEQQGFTHLHVVDLDGARERKLTNLDTISDICRHTQLQVDAGGGIQTDKELEQLFDCGVKQVNIGSLAVRQPELFTDWLKRHGAERLILSADVRGEHVAISGWQETTAMTIQALIEKFLPAGLKYITCTDISRDGMLAGPATEFYSNLVRRFPGTCIIASGGVSKASDLPPLQDAGCYAVIIGKALLEGKMDGIELKNLGLL